jgi:hypothetical protein
MAVSQILRKEVLMKIIFLGIVALALLSLSTEGMAETGASITIILKDKNVIETGVVTNEEGTTHTLIHFDFFEVLGWQLYGEFYNIKDTDQWDFESPVAELDFTAGLNGEVLGFEVNMYVRYIDPVPLVDFSDVDGVINPGDTLNPGFEVRRNFKIGDSNTVSPFIAFDAFVPFENEIVTWEYFAGLYHEWRITSWLIFNQRLRFLYYEMAHIPEEGTVLNYDADLGLHITELISSLTLLKGTSLHIACEYRDPLHLEGNLDLDRKEEFILCGWVTMSF